MTLKHTLNSALLSLLLCSCTNHDAYKDQMLPVEKRVASLMKQMTLPEKVAQMDMFAVWDIDKLRDCTLMKAEGVGAWIGDITPERYNEIQALSELSRLKIPYLIGVDAAHGHALMPGRTIFPTSITMAATFNPELVFQTAQVNAGEIRACGNQWTFAPCVDIVHDARWGRTGETYGECPFLTSMLVRQAVRGLQENDDPQKRVAACAKHLLGGGASIGGVNHGNAEISERMLRSTFLPPFKAAIEAGVLTIMPGHNNVNGIPVHSSKKLLTDIVKNEYQFNGFYITDMGDIENLLPERIHGTATDQKDAVRQGVSAGLDMHMYSWNRRMFIDNLLELVKEGKIAEERIDDAVRRILTVKFQLGLFENRYVDTSRCTFGGEEAVQLAFEAASQSAVLLKNDGNRLPIDFSKHKRVLVTGPNADNQAILGDWTFTQPDDHITTLLEGMESIPGIEVVYSNSGKLKGKKSDVTVATTDPVTQARILQEGGELNEFAIEDAVRKARKCDLAVVAIGGYGIATGVCARMVSRPTVLLSISMAGRRSW